MDDPRAAGPPTEMENTMTTLDFSKIKTAVEAQFARLVGNDMFRTAISKDALWETYLASFPAGTNPLHRTKTQHDCTCCRQFIRAVGDAVAVIDGELVSVWDVTTGDPAYQAVANAMARAVKAHPIEDVFLHPEKSAGTSVTRSLTEDGSVTEWGHFHVSIPHLPNRGRSYYCKGTDIATALSDKRTDHDVLLRGLTELTMSSVEDVLDLIRKDSLYRGREHQVVLSAFLVLKQQFDLLPEEDRDTFAWSMAVRTPITVCRIRSGAIGTLLIDLSAGVDLVKAVKSFETVVMAPQNYRRPTALVSQSMVESAQKQVEELGLTSALERRHARLSDVSIVDVLFADRDARKIMRNAGPFAGVANRPPRPSPKSWTEVDTIPVGKFLEEVVPHVSSIEVLVENQYAGNFVTLVAPVDPLSGRLFGWSNRMSWAYTGDVADSMKERVKRAGGNVTGDLCCRLAWRDFNDLDFHMVEPGGYEIYFSNRHNTSPCGGRLDVDANAGTGTTRTPVENIFYARRSTMKEGTYRLFVHQFCRRDPDMDSHGFEVEIDWLGEVCRMAHPMPVMQDRNVEVATFRYSRQGGVEFLSSLMQNQVQRTVWGLKTGEFHRVTTLMLSPNHWDGAGGIGNRHYFFMLDGARAEQPPRGFYPEFLRPELHEHRKVLEIVGGKTKVQPTEDQLSGLGFSDTKRAEVLVRTKGDIARLVKVAI
jgi:hypothetical protein